jgi:hypothetical protein
VGGEQGLQGLVQQFTQGGLGEVVQSWVGTGQNLPISGEQIAKVLGNGQLAQLAQQFGLNPDTVAAQLAQVLQGPKKQQETVLPVERGRAQVLQPREIEFVFRVEAPGTCDATCTEHPVGANDLQRAGVTYDEVVAVIVEFVTLKAVGIAQCIDTHRIDEHLVAQPLDFADLFGGSGKAQRELGEVWCRIGTNSHQAHRSSLLLYCPGRLRAQCCVSVTGRCRLCDR